MTMSNNEMTREGYKALQKELEHLITVTVLRSEELKNAIEYWVKTGLITKDGEDITFYL